jgi:hypothetical protein
MQHAACAEKACLPRPTFVGRSGCLRRAQEPPRGPEAEPYPSRRHDDARGRKGALRFTCSGGGSSRGAAGALCVRFSLPSAPGCRGCRAEPAPAAAACSPMPRIRCRGAAAQQHRAKRDGRRRDAHGSSSSMRPRRRRTASEKRRLASCALLLHRVTLRSHARLHTLRLAPPSPPFTPRHRHIPEPAAPRRPFSDAAPLFSAAPPLHGSAAPPRASC